MKAGNVKRGLAIAILLVCVVVLPGQASADGPAFSIAPVTVAESGDAIFTVTRTDSSTEAIPLTYVTADVTATSGDYVATSTGSITVPADTASATFTVAIKPDEIDEVDETFSVTATHESGAPVATATATITDNDAPPTVSIGNAPNVVEGGMAKFPLTLVGASERPIVVSYQTIPATSTDFQVASGTLEINPQDPHIPVVTFDDTVVEGNESFIVALNPCPGADPSCTVVPPPNQQATAVIEDNETAPTVSILGAQVVEGARNLETGNVELRFTLSLSAVSGQPVNVSTLTQDGTAVAPTDYQQKSQPFTFAPGDLEKTFVVVVNDDALDEPSETINVALLNASGAQIDTAVGTIVDDDISSALSISDPSADEPSSGTTSMTFTVTLAPASARTVTVGYGTMDGTAAVGSDYTAASGTLTFQPGQTTQPLTVPVIGDTINEDNETVLVNLVNASGARIGDAQGQGTIIDKNAPPSLSISDAAASEGGGARFTVELAGNTLRTVTVGFGTADGTAREPGDYAARRGTLTFAPGEKTKTLEVTVVDDTLAETVETFSVSLGDAVNATITKSRGVATIEASDQVGTSPSGRTLRPATPPASPTLLPKMVLAPRTVNVTKTGFARLFLTCTKLSPIACRGSITLQTTGKPAFKLGSKTFVVAKGKKKTLGVKLSPRARKLLAKRPTLRARVVVLVKTGTKSLRVVPGVITLKAAPKAAKPKATKKSTAPKDTPPKVTVRP